MFRIQNTARNLAVIAALVLIAAAPSGYAQKGGGGGKGGGKGGGGGTDGGSIYFINGAGQGYSTNYMWSINSDGSNVTQLGWAGYFCYPSRALHNGHRWYLAVREIADSYYPDGTTVRSEVFAHRDDFDFTSNNTPDTIVQLTDDPTLQPDFEWFKGMEWHLGDQEISFRARRWSSVYPYSIVEGGLYMANLDYNSHDNIVGLVAPPDTPALAFPLDGTGWPTCGSHSVDPTGTKVVYTDSTDPGLWVADLTANTRTQIFSGVTSYPDWSPDGTKIAFSSSGAISTIEPNGAELKAVITPRYLKSAYWAFGRPYFSPTGGYITCTGYTSYKGSTNNDVFLASSSGSSLTNLTNTRTLNELPVGWR